jgi:hypothetical protein
MSKGVYTPVKDIRLPAVAVDAVCMPGLGCIAVVTQDGLLRTLDQVTAEETSARHLTASSMPSKLMACGSGAVAVGFQDGSIRCVLMPNVHFLSLLAARVIGGTCMVVALEVIKRAAGMAGSC